MAPMLAGGMLGLAGGCADSTAPPGPPYLAIVTDLRAWSGAQPPREVVYRIRSTTASVPFEREVRVPPTDTVILPVPVGNYLVEPTELPSRCVIPRGALRDISLTADDNTGLIRYVIECRTSLRVHVATDGFQPDDAFLYRIEGPQGPPRTGTIASNDTLAVTELGPGEWTVSLGGVAPNCTVTNDGARRVRVAVEATGGAVAEFRVRCSAPAERPQVLEVVAGYDLGANIFAFRVIDPDRDVEGYVWDITDCEGTSVLPDRRERIRRGLRGGRAAGNDTITIVGAYDLGVPFDAYRGRCTELRVFDDRGNTSAIIERRIALGGGSPPIVRFLNATYMDQTAITSLLAATDPDNDIIGTFVFVRLRDGTLGARDGLPDLGSMDPAGYLGLDLPVIPTTGAIRWDDVLSVIVCVIDARGNAVRVEDADLFR